MPANEIFEENVVGGVSSAENGATLKVRIDPTTKRLLVDVGAAVVIDSEFPPATAGGDAIADPTTTSVKALAHGFNGTTWDRLRSDTTFGLDVDVTRSALPTGAATAALQTTQEATLSAINLAVAGANNQLDGLVTLSTVASAILVASNALKNDILGIFASNTGATDAFVTIRDDSTARFVLPVKAGTMAGFMPEFPVLQATANKSWKIVLSAATSAVKTFVQYRRR